MKKPLITALFALTAALTAGAQSRTEVYTFRSEVLGAEKSCTVYLPERLRPLARSPTPCSTCCTAPAAATPTGRRKATCAALPTKPSAAAWPADDRRHARCLGEGPKHTGEHMGYFDVPGWNYERFFFEEFMPARRKTLPHRL